MHPIRLAQEVVSTNALMILDAKVMNQYVVVAEWNYERDWEDLYLFEKWARWMFFGQRVRLLTRLAPDFENALY
jgi:hypothetical protein